MSVIDLAQGTIGESFSLSGVGLHTGQATTVTLRPAPPNHGRVFVTASGARIPAHLDFVVGCDRSTLLGSGDARVSTPEHLLSALAAACIDNVEIAIVGDEVPILDGSALPFWAAIGLAGRVSQGEAAHYLIVDEPMAVGSIDGPMVLVLPSAQPLFEYVLHYPHPMLGSQTVVFPIEEGGYGETIAPARTFALWEEVEPLIARGMAAGGSLDNALVVHQDKFSTPLRLPHEPVCHKCLDLIGDFALLDARIQARVLGIKAGHRWHVEAARKVWEASKLR